MIHRQPAIYLFFLLICLANISSLVAQNKYMVVEKTLRNKSVTYAPGDHLKYMLEGEDFFRENRIIDLNDTSVTFYFGNIAYREIKQIHLQGKHLSRANLKSLGGKLQFAGIAYIALDQFNTVVVRGEDPSWNKNVLIAGGVLYLAGSIIRWTVLKKVKLGWKYKIRYININEY